MALTESLTGELGSHIPDFTLAAVDGRSFSVSDFAESMVLVVMFICNHCPYVKAVEDRVLALHGDYAARGVQVVGICANDPTDYPEDAPKELLRRWKEKAYGFPYLVDESQDVARAFGAVCTPDIYVYDKARKLVYRGRIDDSWKDPAKVNRRELREAIDAILAGKQPPAKQNPSIGCSIKWKRS